MTTNILKKYPSFILIVMLVLLAFIPRLWNLTTSTPLVVDEPAYLRDIAKLLTSPGFYPVNFQWDFSQATLMYYPTILLIQIFHVSNWLLALRIVSVIFSISALIPFYFLAKRYTNITVAFCITLLFSYSYYFLQFSRVGWGVIYTLSLGLYAIFFAITAIERKSIVFVILSGLFSGLTLYSYRSGEIYVVTVIILFLFSKQRLVYLSTFLLTILIIFFPWLNQVIHHWDLFTLRSRVVAINNVNLPYHGLYTFPEIIWYQIKTTFLSWITLLPVNGGGIEDPRYLPLRLSPISPVLIPLFWAGIFFAFQKIQKTFYLFVIYFLGLFFGQILTVDPPNGARGLILLPIIYLFCGLSLFQFYKLYKNNRIASVILVTFSIILALIDFLYYQHWMTFIKV